MVQGKWTVNYVQGSSKLIKMGGAVKMAKGNRENHGSAFKAKLILEAIKEQQTLSELADRLQVRRDQIAKLKKRHLDRAEEPFAKEKDL